jgi:multidrug efflux pump subunit AcrB
LGIVVDDAIVVIENTHRIFANGKVPIKEAAKMAAGEVFLPVFSGTMTTLGTFCSPGFLEQFDRALYVLPANYADHYPAGIVSGGLYHEPRFRG